jgi:hypothetical protein
VVAVDGGNSFLPDLRWAEAKQMVACLQPTWPGLLTCKRFTHYCIPS